MTHVTGMPNIPLVISIIQVVPNAPVYVIEITF